MSALFGDIETLEVIPDDFLIGARNLLVDERFLGPLFALEHYLLQLHLDSFLIVPPSV